MSEGKLASDVVSVTKIGYRQRAADVNTCRERILPMWLTIKREARSEHLERSISRR
jgi:hypothetical protein